MGISAILQGHLQFGRKNAQVGAFNSLGYRWPHSPAMVSVRTDGHNQKIGFIRSIRYPSPSVWPGANCVRSEPFSRQVIHTSSARQLAEISHFSVTRLDFIHRQVLSARRKQEEKGNEACGSRFWHLHQQWRWALLGAATPSRNNHLSARALVQALRCCWMRTQSWVASLVVRQTSHSVTNTQNAANPLITHFSRITGSKIERRLGRKPGRRFAVWGVCPLHGH